MTTSRSTVRRFAILGASLGALTACATASEARIESQLNGIGVSPKRAGCVAGELGDRLDGGQLVELARFLDGVNRAETAGEGLDALLRIDDPRIAGAVAQSAFACAF
ncbi:MAG: hypothetical protein ACFB00_08965 [Parvularculaceae bacterium]